VSEVLDFTRNRRTPAAYDRVNIKDLSREIFHNLQFIDGFNEIKFDDAGIQHDVVISDPSRLKIILQNILSNAIKFRNKNQESIITLSTKLDGGKFMLSIQDNGEGIKPELKNQIFNMFFRGSQQSNGSGLGLYIAREAAKKIDASISVSSTYGKGSVFTLALPASVVPVSADSKKPTPVIQN